MGLGEHGGYLALPGRAALLGGPLSCHLFLLSYGYYQNLFLLLSFLLGAFATVCLCDVGSNLGPGSDNRMWLFNSTFVVFMPIWTSWLWLDQIMMFWFVSGKELQLLSMNGGRFEVNQLLFVDDTALVADSKEK